MREITKKKIRNVVFTHAEVLIPFMNLSHLFHFLSEEINLLRGTTTKNSMKVKKAPRKYNEQQKSTEVQYSAEIKKIPMIMKEKKIFKIKVKA